MKKRTIIYFLLGILIFSFHTISFAEDVFAFEYRVVRCNEYITLRDDASTKAGELARVPLGATVTAFSRAENGFMLVNYAGKQGYVLEKYLEPAPAVYGSSIPMTESVRKNINLFLSNFTESMLAHYTGGVFDAQIAPDGVFVEFAMDHVWFNYHESRIEWGEYANGNNVRVHKKYVPEITEKYFGIVPASCEPIYVDYISPYYYWTETGGHTPGGFASASTLQYLGGDRYLVAFAVLADGEGWNESDTELSLSEARAKFPSYERRGYALIYAPNLNDRATYKLTRFISE